MPPAGIGTSPCSLLGRPSPRVLTRAPPTAIRPMPAPGPVSALGSPRRDRPAWAPSREGRIGSPPFDGRGRGLAGRGRIRPRSGATRRAGRASYYAGGPCGRRSPRALRGSTTRAGRPAGMLGMSYSGRDCSGSTRAQCCRAGRFPRRGRIGASGQPQAFGRRARPRTTHRGNARRRRTRPGAKTGAGAVPRSFRVDRLAAFAGGCSPGRPPGGPLGGDPLRGWGRLGQPLGRERRRDPAPPARGSPAGRVELMRDEPNL